MQISKNEIKILNNDYGNEYGSSYNLDVINEKNENVYAKGAHLGFPCNAEKKLRVWENGCKEFVEDETFK